MAHPKAEINPEWGKRLKRICRECDVSQADLAEKIYISQQTISKIINGKASLTWATASQIAKAFPQYQTEWIMGDTEYKTRFEEFEAFRNSNDLLLQFVNRISAKQKCSVERSHSTETPSPTCDYLTITDAAGNQRIVESDILFRIRRYIEYETSMLLGGNENG